MGTIADKLADALNEKVESNSTIYATNQEVKIVTTTFVADLSWVPIVITSPIVCGCVIFTACICVLRAKRDKVDVGQPKGNEDLGVELSVDEKGELRGGSEDVLLQDEEQQQQSKVNP